ncbi:hypothetical protein EV385_1083 [Krasilnikovia cinnamomea]|uniref:Uncharacterized protein n=1 Tax=Krasilnikovia cinnamomea TaxID=349313 RepID=A0A4Q7ZF62_9ACTN|nr:hypothetical protein [Krasilnikovia cinnamomea]RZU49338.1 hypothetical protein EV385_1083 [Krasilnikovia cinnamomea]
MPTTPRRCAACGELGQYWDGNCEATLCGWCVPEHDEYVVAWSDIQIGKAHWRRRPRQPGELPRHPRWRTR